MNSHDLNVARGSCVRMIYVVCNNIQEYEYISSYLEFMSISVAHAVNRSK